MAKFVANKDVNKTHDIVLNELFCDAVRLDWQIAFASVNGVNAIHDNFLNFIKSNNSHTARITIGLDYYHSEPDALDYFFDLSKKYPSQIEFYVSNPDGECVFHPKTYVFHYANDDEKFARVLIGSANLTSGGLGGNYEFSARILLKFDENGENTFLCDFENHTQEIIDVKEVVPATKKILEQYRKEHKYYHLYSALAKKKAKSAINKGDVDPYEYFRVILEEFKSEVKPYDFQSEVNDRDVCRQKALQVLNHFVSHSSWTENDFLSQYRLLVSTPTYYWRSSMIGIQQQSVANTHVHFISGLSSLQTALASGSLTPAAAYDVLHSEFVKVSGAGPNVISEILHSYDNTCFAVMNSRSVSELNKVSNVKFPPNLNKNTVTGMIYQQFCDEAKKVCNALGLNNFSEFDALMNYDYIR